jgi:hypothetical protein
MNIPAGKKAIIIDVMNGTGEIKVESVGFSGSKCLQESEFIADAIGETIERALTPAFYSVVKEGENEKVVAGGKTFLNLCG